MMAVQFTLMLRVAWKTVISKLTQHRQMVVQFTSILPALLKIVIFQPTMQQVMAVLSG